MIISKKIEIPLHPKTISYYENLGYEIPRQPAKWNKDVLTVPMGSKIIINVEHLTSSSNVKIEFECDYCGEKGTKKYCDLIKSRDIIPKDCCANCTNLKAKESNLIKYGVEHTTQLKSTKDKMKSTNLKIYGTEHATQNNEVKEKMKNTFIKNYGTTSPAKNENIKEKMKQTNIERYGYVSPTLNDEVRQKQINTLIENYGVEYPQQNKDIKQISMKSLYENNSAPCSRQQKYIHDLIGGKLNYPHGNAFLDIAFLDEKIYVEIDLGGHELQLKFGNITKDEYEIKERNRWYALYRKGWKEIRIISTKDKIPTDEKLIEMMQFARNYLNSGHHYIKFLLDEGKVLSSQFTKDYNFGDLRYIYKDTLLNTN